MIPSAASIIGFQRLRVQQLQLESMCIWLMLGLLVYSGVKIAFTSRDDLIVQVARSSTYSMTEAMLFRSSEHYDTLLLRRAYNPTTNDLELQSHAETVQSSVRVADVLPGDAERGDRAAVLAGSDGVVLQRNGIVQYVDTEKGTRYALHENLDSLRLATFDGQHQKLLYTRVLNDEYRVHIHSQRCQENEDVTAFSLKKNKAPQATLDAYGLPAQQRLILSPTGSRLLLLDHAYSARLTLIDMVSHTAKQLDIPDMKNDVHFSPLFATDDSIIFSVVNDGGWATMRFDNRSGTYEKLSDEFSDALYRAVSGEIVFVRSYTNASEEGAQQSKTGRNVPFGSRVIVGEAQTGVSAQRILAVLRGSAESPTVLEQVRYIMDADQSYYIYDESIEPLLEAIGASRTTIAEYTRKRRSAERNGGEYRLIDAW